MIYVLIVISAVVVAGITGYSLKSVAGRRTRALRRHLKERLHRLCRRHRELTGCASLMREHSGTYFIGLHEAGLSRLIAVIDELGQALEDGRVLLKHDRLEELASLLSYLRGSAGSCPPELAMLVSANLEMLEGWEEKCTDLTSACIDVLKESSIETDELLIDRRRLTIHTLVDLRRALTPGPR